MDLEKIKKSYLNNLEIDKIPNCTSLYFLSLYSFESSAQ